MENLEYEYSFKANSLLPYINYCQKNKYIRIEKSNETRVLYKNNTNFIARLTTKENNQVIIDYKFDDESNKLLKESLESKPIYLNTLEEALILLKKDNYQVYKVLKRKRITYKKEQVIFELDEYIYPNEMNVVAIEGEKTQVDKVYLEISKINMKD